MNWESKAACKLVDQNIFFPTSEQRASVARARVYCDSCRVKTECLMYSIEKGETVKPGIWGGLTTLERTRIRKSFASVR